MLVGLDCGHGMFTGGKRTPIFKKDIFIDGKKIISKGECIHENEWNRAVAKYCAAALKRNGINYYYTADNTGKEDTPLSTRSKRANNKKCDILVSFHYNAFGSCSNFLDRKGGLLVLRTKNCSNNSIKLGNLIAEELEKNIDYKYSYGLKKDVDISGFTLAILKQTNMPSVLVEYGFMDVYHEAVLMRDIKHQKKCGEATAKAICKYFSIKFKNENESEKDQPKEDKFQIKVLVDNLSIRKVADWNATPVSKVNKGQYLEVIDTVQAKNGDTKMYQLESKLYITSSSKYVQKIGK